MGKHRDKRNTWRLFMVEWREWGASLLVMDRRETWLLAPNKRQAARLVSLRNPKQMHFVTVQLAPGE